MRLLAVSLAVALVSTAAPAAQVGPYRAQGTVPAWSLALENERITYSTPGKSPVTIEAPAPIDDDGIVYYRSNGFELTVMRMACRDEASGRRYADSVFLTVAGKQYVGCGGALLPADSLDGTSWYFAEIGGEATGLTGDIFKDDRYALDFSGDRFVGYSGCNRIGGRYQIAGGVMTITEFGSTRRGCGEPHARRELTAWRIMSGPMRVGRPSPDVLQLSGESATIKLKRSAD